MEVNWKVEFPTREVFQVILHTMRTYPRFQVFFVPVWGTEDSIIHSKDSIHRKYDQSSGALKIWGTLLYQGDFLYVCAKSGSKTDDSRGFEIIYNNSDSSISKEYHITNPNGYNVNLTYSIMFRTNFYGIIMNKYKLS